MDLFTVDTIGEPNLVNQNGTENTELLYSCEDNELHATENSEHSENEETDDECEDKTEYYGKKYYLSK